MSETPADVPEQPQEPSLNARGLADLLQTGSAADTVPDGLTDETAGSPKETAVESVSREPVPSDADQKDARRLVKEVYSEEYENAKDNEQKQALAKKLLDSARESQNSANRYVLLQAVGKLAVKCGDVMSAFSAINEMSRTFQVDPIKMKVDVLGSLPKKRGLLTGHESVGEIALKLADEAIRTNDFGSAKKSAGIALSEARKARQGKLVKQIADLARDIEKFSTMYEEVKAAEKVLERSPADPDANLLMGRFRCFVNGDWETGLPMLALGSDATLRALAAQELKGVSDPTEQVRLADGWWKLAKTEEGLIGQRLYHRAAYWYQQVDPKLTGLMKTHVEKRLAEIGNMNLYLKVIPPDAKEFQGHYYKVIRTLMTWHVAGRECEKMGGHLVRIESPQEQQFVHELTGKSGIHWIDGSDEFQEGQWVWGNGTKIAYANWDRGQPNNAKKIQHSMVIVESGKWGDDPSSYRYHFVCEWDGVYCNPTPKRSAKIKRPPRGAIRFAGHRYMWFDQSVTWHVAKRLCEAMGGHLARIESKEENAFIKKLVENGKHRYYSIDGSDEAVEGVWVFSDGRKVTYTNWDKAQPDVFIEHSMLIRKGNGLWHDGYNSHRIGFVCEWD